MLKLCAGRVSHGSQPSAPTMLLLTRKWVKITKIFRLDYCIFFSLSARLCCSLMMSNDVQIDYIAILNFITILRFNEGDVAGCLFALPEKKDVDEKTWCANSLAVLSFIDMMASVCREKRKRAKSSLGRGDALDNGATFFSSLIENICCALQKSFTLIVY